MPIVHQYEGLKVTHLSRLALESVAKLGIDDTYEFTGPLPDAATAKLGHTVFGNDTVHEVVERCKCYSWALAGLRYEC